MAIERPLRFFDYLIATKEAAGRTKDKLIATECPTLSDVIGAPRSELSG